MSIIGRLSLATDIPNLPNLIDNTRWSGSCTHCKLVELSPPNKFDSPDTISGLEKEGEGQMKQMAQESRDVCCTYQHGCLIDW